MSPSAPRESGIAAKPRRTTRKSTSADRCFRTCGVTLAMRNPLTRTAQSFQPGVLSHRSLRKASAVHPVITGLEGPAGIAGEPPISPWILALSRSSGLPRATVPALSWGRGPLARTPCGLEGRVPRLSASSTPSHTAHGAAHGRAGRPCAARAPVARCHRRLCRQCPSPVRACASRCSGDHARYLPGAG